MRMWVNGKDISSERWEMNGNERRKINNWYFTVHRAQWFILMLLFRLFSGTGCIISLTMLSQHPIIIITAHAPDSHTTQHACVHNKLIHKHCYMWKIIIQFMLLSALLLDNSVIATGTKSSLVQLILSSSFRICQTCVCWAMRSSVLLNIYDQLEAIELLLRKNNSIFMSNFENFSCEIIVVSKKCFFSLSF